MGTDQTSGPDARWWLFCGVFECAPFGSHGTLANNCRTVDLHFVANHRVCEYLNSVSKPTAATDRNASLNDAKLSQRGAFAYLCVWCYRAVGLRRQNSLHSLIDSDGMTPASTKRIAELRQLHRAALVLK